MLRFGYVLLHYIAAFYSDAWFVAKKGVVVVCRANSRCILSARAARAPAPGSKSRVAPLYFTEPLTLVQRRSTMFIQNAGAMQGGGWGVVG